MSESNLPLLSRIESALKEIGVELAKSSSVENSTNQHFKCEGRYNSDSITISVKVSSAPKPVNTSTLDALLIFLNSHGIRAPCPMLPGQELTVDTSSGPYLATVYHWIDGSPLTLELDGPTAYTAGAILAKAHSVLSHFGERKQLPNLGALSPTQINALEFVIRNIPSDDVQFVRDAISNAAQIHVVTFQDEAIHGDAHLGNFIVDRDGALAILDFDDAGCFDRRYDFVTMALSLLNHPNFVMLTNCAFNGYRSVLPIEFSRLQFFNLACFRLCVLLARISQKQNPPRVTDIDAAKITVRLLRDLRTLSGLRICNLNL
jgi:Ser/Thr protein kinase RdoA (MazF antagonist)